MLWLFFGFVLGLAAAALWRFAGRCMVEWMDDLAPGRRAGGRGSPEER